jgi:hypothetical protein
MQTGLIYTENCLVSLSESNPERGRRKMERLGSGMEDSKERRGDRGEQTHAKPPPTAPGDLGSSDKGPPPPEEEGRATDSSWGQRGAGQGPAQNSINDPAGPGCQRRRMHSTMGLRAQVSLVTHEYAREAGFKRRPASIRITGVGAGSGGESSVQYKALLR